MGGKAIAGLGMGGGAYRRDEHRNSPLQSPPHQRISIREVGLIRAAR